jgi:3-oxoacyl-[acyl-carrier-protein] synthase II
MTNLEILDYRYITSWNLDLLLNDNSFNQNIQSNFPVIATTETGTNSQLQKNLIDRFSSGKKRGKPSEIQQSSADSTLLYVANNLKTNAECLLTNATCSSSSYALYLASLISLEKQLPVVVFCGDDLTSEFNLWRFNSFNALDQDTGIPFDKSSKGFKMGVGAALLLVKHPSVKSNIQPVALIKKFHFYTNPSLIANPGLVDDIVENLKSINFKTVNFWNAHATGTPVGDSVEYNVFNKLCNDSTPIVSYKHYIGHCISGSNVLEILLAIEDKNKNILRPNLIKQEKIFQDSRIIDSVQSWPGNNMIKASFGFGGRTSILEIEIY